jgi:hypothetical protein
MSKKRLLEEYLAGQNSTSDKEESSDNPQDVNIAHNSRYDWEFNLKNATVYKINCNGVLMDIKNEKSYKDVRWFCEKTKEEGTCCINFLEDGIRITYYYNKKKIYDKYDIPILSNGNHYGVSLFGKFIWHININHNNDWLRGRYQIVIEKKFFNIKKKIGRPKKKKPKINDDDYLKKMIGCTTKRKVTPRSVMNIAEFIPDSDPSHSEF